MQLSKKAIIDFKAAYAASYGEDIADEEAVVMAEEVLRLIRLLLRHANDKQRSSDQVGSS